MVLLARTDKMRVTTGLRNDERTHVMGHAETLVLVGSR